MNIDVEKFAERMHEMVNEFAKSWHASRSADPSNWPEKMPEIDWSEQFTMFIGE